MPKAYLDTPSNADDFFAPTNPGATAATRYVGGTASGAPASGTFLVGDFVVSQTGRLFICTVAGTPGTWTEPSAAAIADLADTYVAKVATQGGTAGAPTPTTVWRFNAPSGDTHAPFTSVVGGAAFLGTFDRVKYDGYNAADAGGKVVAAEPRLSDQIESDYDDGGSRSMEKYPEYYKAGDVVLADGATTNGSPTVTSATGAFSTTKHRGMAISGTGIPASTYVGVVNSATSIGLSSSATANVPVNATATATGVSLTVGPSGPTSFRPFFFKINRATGALQFEINSTSGFSFNTTDGAQTNWGSLGPTGLGITPLAGQSASLTLGWKAGGQNFIQIANSTNGFLLQPASAGSATWEVWATTKAFIFTATQFQASGSIWVGAVASGGYKAWNAARSNQADWLSNDGADGLVVGSTSVWTGTKITGLKLGFFSTAPITKPTGVTVDAAGIHAALVSLGLIAA